MFVFIRLVPRLSGSHIFRCAVFKSAVAVVRSALTASRSCESEVWCLLLVFIIYSHFPTKLLNTENDCNQVCTLDLIFDCEKLESSSCFAFIRRFIESCSWPDISVLPSPRAIYKFDGNAGARKKLFNFSFFCRKSD